MAASKKAQSKHHGQWTVVAREGHINLKTNRIGIFTIDATAPIVGGEADWQAGQATLTLEVGINEVKTGNRLLDPEVHALVNSGSDGVLTLLALDTSQIPKSDSKVGPGQEMPRFRWSSECAAGSRRRRT